MRKQGNRSLYQTFYCTATVAIQNPVRLNKYNELQPDVTVAKWRADFYSTGHPTSKDILLIIEVADTTLQKDMRVKLPIYARLGIPEVWIEDLKQDLVLVFRDPEGESYKVRETLHRGDSLATLAFPEILFTVDELLG